MGHSILDNHSHFNNFQVMEGIRVSTSTPVTPYILEVKIKKVIANAKRKTLEQVAEKIYGNIGYNTHDLIKEQLVICAENCGEPGLAKCLEFIRKDGLIEGLIYLIEL